MAIPAHIFEMPMSALFDMRGRAEDLAAAAGDLELPSRPNTSSANERSELYWVGPEHWLLRAGLDTEADWLEHFRRFTANPDPLISQVSDAYAFLEISGEGAEDLLATATTVNFRRLGAGAALFTEIFGLKALLIIREGSCEIAVENSLKDHVVLRFRTAIS